MNLSDFRTRVARVTGMSTSASADTNLIDAWANEAVEQFLKETKINVIPASLAVTADQGDYSLDADILALLDVYYVPASGESLLMEPISTREITDMRLWSATTDTAPRYYSLQGAHLLRIHPAPVSSSDTLHLLYVPKPSTTLSVTSDSPSTNTKGNIPTEYHPILEAYVKWKAAEAEEHKPSQGGLAFQAEWERGLKMVRRDLNKKTGVYRGRKVGMHNRRRPYPTTPGIDWR